MREKPAYLSLSVYNEARMLSLGYTFSYILHDVLPLGLAVLLGLLRTGEDRGKGAGADQAWGEGEGAGAGGETLGQSRGRYTGIAWQN